MNICLGSEGPRGLAGIQGERGLPGRVENSLENCELIY